MQTSGTNVLGYQAWHRYSGSDPGQNKFRFFAYIYNTNSGPNCFSGPFEWEFTNEIKRFYQSYTSASNQEFTTTMQLNYLPQQNDDKYQLTVDGTDTGARHNVLLSVTVKRGPCADAARNGCSLGICKPNPQEYGIDIQKAYTCDCTSTSSLVPLPHLFLSSGGRGCSPCPAGQLRDSDETKCRKVNECKEKDLGPDGVHGTAFISCGTGDICQDLDVGYTCECPAGFEIPRPGMDPLRRYTPASGVSSP